MKLSVAITTYNHHAYIAQALDGVLMQEVDFDYEIVVGDDCSTDGTREIVRDYAARHPDRIRAVLPDRNLGDGGKPLFAATLELCSGRYVAFMDGDDYWIDPGKLACQVALLDDRPDVSMCFHNVVSVSGSGNEATGSYNAWSSDGEIALEALLDNCAIASCSPVFRREALIPLPEWYFSLRYGDWPLYVLAALRGRIYYFARRMGAYRIHRGGMWSGQAETAKRRRELAEFYEDMVEQLSLRRYRTARERLSTYLYRAAKDSAGESDWRAARSFAWRALRARPAQPLRQTLELCVLVAQPRVSAVLARRRVSG